MFGRRFLLQHEFINTILTAFIELSMAVYLFDVLEVINKRMVELLSNQTYVYGFSHSQKPRQVLSKFRFLKSKPGATRNFYRDCRKKIRFLKFLIIKK
jgi:hypothetical protein